MRNGIVLLLLFSGIALGGGSSLHPAATQPAVSFSPSPPFPNQFQILLTRSIFAKSGVSSSRSIPATQETAPALALRGIVLKDGIYMAMMEDPASHQMQSILEGAVLAGGRVSHITLRGFDYDAGGKTVPISVGLNLQGQSAAFVPTTGPSPTAVAQGAPAATPGVEAAQTPPGPPGGASNDAVSANTVVVNGSVVLRRHSLSKR